MSCGTCECCGVAGDRLVRHHWHDRRDRVHYRTLCRLCNAVLVPGLFLHYLVVGNWLPPWETQKAAVLHVRGLKSMDKRRASAVLSLRRG